MYYKQYDPPSKPCKACTELKLKPIPIVVENFRMHDAIRRQPSRQRVLPHDPLHRTDGADADILASDRIAPSLYVLNAASLGKPHAVEQLAADLISYSADIAVITETHFKVKHMDAAMNVPEFTMCRRDRQRRRACGVAVYVRSSPGLLSGAILPVA